MKRRTFVLSGAGAAIAGCAGPSLAPNALVNAAARPAARHAPAGSDTQLIGSLLLVPYDFVPRHFEKAAGQILPIKSNLTLYVLLGNRFGGDGKNDFGLPDMRKHQPIEGLTYLIATSGIFPNRKALDPDVGVDPLIGQLSLVAYVPKYTPPPGWAACDGQLLKISDHQALYSLLGTKFGGDSRTTFALPDLRKNELLKGITYVIALRGRFPTVQ
ncbi:MAG: tail fiber protein [Candidatus Baltobacteraceae bacterium]